LPLSGANPGFIIDLHPQTVPSASIKPIKTVSHVKTSLCFIFLSRVIEAMGEKVNKCCRGAGRFPFITKKHSYTEK